MDIFLLQKFFFFNFSDFMNFFFRFCFSHFSWFLNILAWKKYWIFIIWIDFGLGHIFLLQKFFFKFLLNLWKYFLVLTIRIFHDFLIVSYEIDESVLSFGLFLHLVIFFWLRIFFYNFCWFYWEFFLVLNILIFIFFPNIIVWKNREFLSFRLVLVLVILFCYKKFFFNFCRFYKN